PRLLGHADPPEDRAHEIRSLEPGLDAVNLAPHDSMREFVLRVVRYGFIYRAVFDNRVVRRFLRFVPSLGELTMFGKVWFHESERADGSNPTFDALLHGVTHEEDGERAEELIELEAQRPKRRDPAESFGPAAPGGAPGGDASRPRWDVLLLDLPAT